MFIHRLITGLIITAISGWVLFATPAWGFAILVTAFVVLGLNEFLELIQNKQIKVNKVSAIILGILLIWLTYFSDIIPKDYWLAFLPALFLLNFIIQFGKRDKQVILSVCALLFGAVYVSWLLSFFLRIRCLPGASELLRRQLVAYLILVVKSGDIWAYFIGVRFGRHSLIPRISPNKTVEGMLGGLLFSVLVSLACIGFLTQFSAGQLIILGLVLGVLAQVGDLAESLIKRDCAVKDSGKAFPGLGGVLDTIDSFLFTAPAFYFYLRVYF